MTSLGQQPEFLTELDGLRPSPRAQFVKNAAGVGLNGVFTHKKLRRDLTVAHTLSNELKNLKLAGCDPELLSFLIVRNKRLDGWDRNFLYDGLLSSG